jgi:hypothetical protein
MPLAVCLQILHHYCPANDQLHGKELFDAILGHVVVNKITCGKLG